MADGTKPQILPAHQLLRTVNSLRLQYLRVWASSSSWSRSSSYSFSSVGCREGIDIHGYSAPRWTPATVRRSRHAQRLSGKPEDSAITHTRREADGTALARERYCRTARSPPPLGATAQDRPSSLPLRPSPFNGTITPLPQNREPSFLTCHRSSSARPCI
jgi:hypothetical protein